MIIIVWNQCEAYSDFPGCTDVDEALKFELIRLWKAGAIPMMKECQPQKNCHSDTAFHSDTQYFLKLKLF